MQWGDCFGWVLDEFTSGQGTRGHYPAICDNYQLSRKNASYHLVIWNGQLWGERFQPGAIERRRIVGREGRELWVENKRSLELMVSLEADILCEGHCGIYRGKKEVTDFITQFMIKSP